MTQMSKPVWESLYEHAAEQDFRPALLHAFYRYQYLYFNPRTLLAGFDLTITMSESEKLFINHLLIT